MRRVLTALRGEIHDRVPWVEETVGKGEGYSVREVIAACEKACGHKIQKVTKRAALTTRLG